jgi:hypothetical protein
MPRRFQLVQLLERRTWRQQTGGSAGHHAVMVVSAGGAVTPGQPPCSCQHAAELVRAGIGFVDGVQHEGKASKLKAKAA